MAGARPRTPEIPSRDVLEGIVGHYRHVKAEHRRAHPKSAVRRHLEAQLVGLASDFEGLLTEWVAPESLRKAWRDHLYHGGPAPNRPRLTPALVFAGRSDAGSLAEIRRGSGEELEVQIDGALVGRIVGGDDFSGRQTPALFHRNDAIFYETWRVSVAALTALRTFLAEGGAPPWRYARELAREGIVDRTFALTPRGARALRFARTRRRRA